MNERDICTHMLIIRPNQVRCPGSTSIRGGGHAVRGHAYPVQYCACAYAYTCDRDAFCKRTIPQNPYSRRDGYPKVPPAWPKPVVGASYPISRHAYVATHDTYAYAYTCDRDTVCKRAVPQHPYSRRDGYRRVPPAWPKPVGGASYPISRQACPL